MKTSSHNVIKEEMVWLKINEVNTSTLSFIRKFFSSGSWFSQKDKNKGSYEIGTYIHKGDFYFNFGK